MQFGAFQRMVRLARRYGRAWHSSLACRPLPAAAARASARRARPVRRSHRPGDTTVSEDAPPPRPDEADRIRPAPHVRAAPALAQARADGRAREMREVQTPRFKIDELGQEVPDVRAEAAIIYNPETNQVLWESNAQDQRSIASITKVMTALVFLESGMPLSTPVTVQRGDVYRASTTYLRAGYQVTADDLLNLLLIGSDNAAARALARISPYGSAGFIDQMNQKAAELGLDADALRRPVRAAGRPTSRRPTTWRG